MKKLSYNKMAKGLTLSQKSIGCGFMVQNHEAIYAEDVKKAVNKYYNWLNDNVEYQERDRLFNKFKEIFGDFPNN